MKIKPLLLIAILLCTGKLHAQKVVFNKSLADSLATLVKVDQIAAFIPTNEYKKLTREQWDKFKDSVFSTHKIILENLFNKHGFPGYDLVGQEGSNHFWLMVQHCDKWPEFQQKVLDAMNPQVLRKNADPKNFAYLTDRVNLNTGKK